VWEKMNNWLLDLSALKKVIISCLIALLMVTSGNASIAISVSCYNSEGAVSESFGGENGQFSQSMVMLPSEGYADYPFSISSIGFGKSTDTSQSDFRHETGSTDSENTKGTSASAATKSGGWFYREGAEIGSQGSHMIDADSYIIGDGSIDAAYGNGDASLSQHYSSTQAQFFSHATITSNSIDTKGSGKSINPDHSMIQHITQLTNGADSDSINSMIETTSGAWTSFERTRINPFECSANIQTAGAIAGNGYLINAIGNGESNLFLENSMTLARYLAYANVDLDSLSYAGNGGSTSNYLTGFSSYINAASSKRDVSLSGSVIEGSGASPGIDTQWGQEILLRPLMNSIKQEIDVQGKDGYITLPLSGGTSSGQDNLVTMGSKFNAASQQTGLPIIEEQSFPNTQFGFPLYLGVSNVGTSENINMAYLTKMTVSAKWPAKLSAD
jgi:hypothetical protein